MTRRWSTCASVTARTATRRSEQPGPSMSQSAPRRLISSCFQGMKTAASSEWSSRTIDSSSSRSREPLLATPPRLTREADRNRSAWLNGTPARRSSSPRRAATRFLEHFHDGRAFSCATRSPFPGARLASGRCSRVRRNGVQRLACHSDQGSAHLRRRAHLLGAGPGLRLDGALHRARRGCSPVRRRLPGSARSGTVAGQRPDQRLRVGPGVERRRLLYYCSSDVLYCVARLTSMVRPACVTERRRYYY